MAFRATVDGLAPACDPAPEMRQSLMRSVTALFLFLAATIFTAEARQPNFVIFLTDDQGWGDLSINGNTNLSTPNIDSLARDGVTMDNFYVCAVCAPTRAEFLTGRYYPKTGVSGVSRGEGRINPDETTIADLFRKNGYATGAFGKWHNGTQSPYHPNDRGFEEYYGFTSGHWGHYFSPPLDHNGAKVRGEGYVVDDFTNHAIEFIGKNREKPFFCYLPYNTPHSPMMIDDEFYEKFADLDPKMKHRDPGKEDLAMTRAALAMCENIDWNVGRILQKLEDLKLNEDTIVIYFSDNGPNSFRWNGGMKGKKGNIDEGGVRSPFFLRWPGKVPAGKTITQVSAALDLLPTLTALAEIKVDHEVDGQDFSSLLLGEVERLPSRNLFSIRKNQVSVRTGKFRLDASGKLFSIDKDRGQTTNIAAEYPEIVTRLQSEAKKFNAGMQKHFAANAGRPFTVGYSESTTLPARDGIEHGTIQRSSKAPNNSFFENWTSEEGFITWSVEVGQAGEYEATVYYTCAEGDTGATVRLALDSGNTFTEAKVTEVFDPPLYDKSRERVGKSHYFVKDFKPLKLGTLRLKKGRASLRLSAPEIPGREAVDVHSIELVRQSGNE